MKAIKRMFPRLVSSLSVGILLIGSNELRAAEASLLSAPKVAARNHQPDVVLGSGLRGRQIGNNIYQNRPSSRQTLFRTPGPMVISFFRVQNDTLRPNAPAYSIFLIRSASTAPKTSVTYFNTSGKNITAQVARGKYALNVPAGAERLLIQKISTTPAGGGSFGLKAQHRSTRRSDAAQVTLRKQ